jgi:hypothetical protein
VIVAVTIMKASGQSNIRHLKKYYATYSFTKRNSKSANKMITLAAVVMY